MNRDTITLPRSVLEQALEAMESGVTGTDYDRKAKALRAALEQPQPKREPIPNVMMDLGWELHGSESAYQAWRMAVEWAEQCHGIGGQK